MGKKVIVTGITGFIASHTAVRLLQEGYNVVGFDNLSNSSQESLHRVERIAGRKVSDFRVMDLKSESALDNLFRDHADAYAVVHFAGLKAVGESWQRPLEYHANNVGGSINLYRAMGAHGIRNIVFSSSATVYGDNNPVPFTEDMPITKGISPYADTKIANEFILQGLQAADRRWNVVILRYFNPIGAHESGLIGEDPNGIPNNLLPFIAQVAVGRQPILKVYGNDYPTTDGTCRRDYIHVMDLAEAHVLPLEKMESNPGILVCNVGTGTPYSVLEVIDAFKRVSGIDIPYRVVERRPGDRPESYAKPDFAAQALGFRAKRGIDEMCRDAWNWQSRNPNGYKAR